MYQAGTGHIGGGSPLEPFVDKKIVYYADGLISDEDKKRYSISDLPLFGRTEFKSAIESVYYGGKDTCNNRSLRSITFVPMDKDYIKWLKDNNKENSQESEREYMITLPHDAIQKKWELYDLGHIYHMCAVIAYICFTVEDNTNAARMHLDNKAAAALSGRISSIYNGSEVYVPGDVLSVAEFFNNYEIHRKRYIAAADGGDFDGYACQKIIKDGNSYAGLFCIPYLIHEKLGCTINVNDYLGIYNGSKDLPFLILHSEIDALKLCDFNNSIIDSNGTVLGAVLKCLAGREEVISVCDHLKIYVSGLMDGKSEGLIKAEDIIRHRRGD